MFSRHALRFALLVLSLTVSTAGVTSTWFDGARPSVQAHQAVELLNDAASHGLSPADYGSQALQHALERAAQAPLADPDLRARLEHQLQDALVRYLDHLHRGRVDPRRIHHDFAAERGDTFDAAAALQQALASNRLPEAIQAAVPQVPLYASLRKALAHYRNLAEQPAWAHSLPPVKGKLEPGQAYPGLELLARRLQLLGDLDTDPIETLRYDGQLVDAVRGFQERHALAVDGVIGRATLAQLEITPTERVRQIELMLERLRWTPLFQGPRMIVINIPEFVLRAYEVEGGRIHVRREMKVIVGKALDTRTPLFDEDMRFIEFSPYWNVPPSIVRRETVPKLRRDPAEFDRQGFEFVAPGGQVLTTLTPERLNAVLAGQLRIRQRPGARNALGDIKFVFPNRNNIFLHHTPTTQLFDRDRRDFSHGCIRVDQPVELATFVMQHQPGWTEDRIRQAMVAGRSSTVQLSQPLPVLIAYGTTLVKQGRIYFLDDIYGLDRVLDAALRQFSRPPRPPN